MEFQILDVDYVMVNGKVVIRLFGKTESGETVCGFYDKFLPYFYTEGENVREILKNENLVLGIEESDKRPLGLEKHGKLLKVTLSNPAKTPEIRERLKAAGLKVYEADILFKYRFMNDFGLNGCGWVKVLDYSNMNTETVQVDRKINIAEMEPLDKKEYTGLKYLAFDIECIPIKPGNMPEAKTDPIIMISLVFNTLYKGRKSLVLATRPGKGVAPFPDEKEMLKEFVRVIEGYDPDILTGYNVQNFDIPYILERMKKNRVDPLIGRCRQKRPLIKRIMSRYRTSIVGRVVLDSFEIVKKDFSLHRYNLDNVASSLIGEKKGDVKHSEIEKLWRGSTEDYEKLVGYGLKDSILAMNLVLKLNLIDKYLALSKISGTLPQDTLGGGEAIRIENFLLREFNKSGYVFPCRPSEAEIGKRKRERGEDELGGGFVLEPVKGLHSNVVVLDFKSMYPTIIRTFNICPTTIAKGGAEGTIKTPSGGSFLSPEVREGIIPRILKGLMEGRAEAKKRLKNAKEEGKKRSLFAEQWALKIMANAFYGYLGYLRASIYNLNIANAITGSGRRMIQDTAKKIREAYGYEVVYGDTDSVFVKLPFDDLDKIEEASNKIVGDVNAELPGVIELEFEKVFTRFLPLTKKRYVGLKLEKSGEEWKEGMEMKGIETVRRDWCQLTGDVLSEVIDIILKREDVKGSVEYFKGVVEKLVSGEVEINKLVITKTMTKLAKNYVGVQPHIELAKKLQARSPADAPGVGDRIGYVIIKGTDLLSRRTEDPNYVLEKGLQIDSNYYIENQLLPPMERVFGALGISKSELLGGGKQIGLLEAIRNGNGKLKAGSKADTREEIGLDTVNGFICKACNKSFGRPPLIGACECGGQILFSSPKGTTEQVIVG